MAVRKKKATAKAATPPKAIPAPRAAPARKAAQASEVCPRCGTPKFAPEERTRFEGRRSVRSTVLVCERGHTFAKPALRSSG